MSTPALELRDVTILRDRREVLHGVDLSVARGEVVAILGPNGAGKSTLLDAASGLLPIAGGALRVTGRVASVRQTPGLARRSVLANVELALRWWGAPRAGRGERARRALTELRADHLAERPALSLSGGEARRVHLARGIALAPDVLLLDEPFSGLDPQAHVSVRDDTTPALRATGAAVVLVLHDRADAWAVADRIVVVMQGRVVASGPPREVIDAPPTAEVARFLGYDGELRQGDAVVLTRPSDVVLDPTGPLDALVERVVRGEGTDLLTLTVPGGQVRAYGTGVRPGDQVRARLTGGRRYEP